MPESAPPDPAAPEQSFFRDPVLDRVMGVLFNMAAELQVLRDRVMVTEMLLEQAGVVDRAGIDRFMPSAGQADALAAESRAYVANILAPILHRQASRSAHGEGTGS